MNRNLLIHHLYTTTSGKYLKFKTRLDKALQTGRFYKFSKRKQSSLISRLKRLFERLKSLHTQLRLAGAGAAFALTFSLSTEIKAQSLGPFTVNDAANPLPPPIRILRPRPAAVDIDNDGDLDVFVGNFEGDIEFFQNNNGLNPTNLKRFVKKEGVDNPLDGVNKGYYAAPAFADVDKDGDFDMLLGAGYGYTFFFRNTGTKSSPIFTEEIDANNPFDGIRGSGGYSYSSKYSEYSSAVPIFAQIDGSADVDLFIASSFTSVDNGKYPDLNFPAVKYYQNDGTAVPGGNDAEFIFEPSNLLADKLANLNNTSLAFADIDGDGDLDAFVGSSYSRIRFFKNDPADLTGFVEGFGIWDPVNKTGNPMYDFSFNNFSSPVAADFDGDGDTDLLVAEYFNEYDYRDINTNLRYFENTAGDSNPEVTDFVYVEKSDLNISPFGGVDVFEEAKPVFVDLDNDNDLDMVIGHKYTYQDDELFVYINKDGEYVADPKHPLVSIINNNEETNAPVFIDIDGDKDMDLFLARDYKIEFFRNIGTDKKVEIFQLEPNLFPSLTNGTADRLSPAFLDVDNDGDFDALIANNNSPIHIEYFENQGTAQLSDFVSATPPAPFDTFGELPLGTYLNASDLDRDGDMDVTLSFTYGFKYSETIFALSENLGNGTFGDLQPIINDFSYYSSYIPGGSVATFVDWDDDGDLDGIIGNGFYNYDYYEAGTITYYENTNPAPIPTLPTAVLAINGGTATLLVPGFTLDDSDNDKITRAIISITNFRVGDEVLSFTPQLGITGSFDATTGVLTLSGSASVSDYIEVIKTVAYQFIGSAPKSSGRLSSSGRTQALTLNRSINFSIFDQDATNPLPAAMAAQITFPNNPPVIGDNTGSTQIGNTIDLDFTSLITDPDDNLDAASLKVIIPPGSGASYIITGLKIKLDYTGTNFAGPDQFTIEVCDLALACTQKVVNVVVEGDVVVFNGISPNGDGFNDFFELKNIVALEPNNKVSIYTRWGDKVFEVENYDNDQKKFIGLNDNGNELTSGVYFYKVKFASGKADVTGYLTIKR